MHAAHTTQYHNAQPSQPTLLDALRALVARYEADGIPNDSQPTVQAAHAAIAAAAAPNGLNLQPGEHYAGVILDAQGKVAHHLVLMAAEPANELTWKDALAWAESVGGSLPTRQEQALLFSNCKPHIKPDWYWSGEQFAASLAWTQYFYGGYQALYGKGAELRARAVRRFAA